jgi:hypothetical protein
MAKDTTPTPAPTASTAIPLGETGVDFSGGGYYLDEAEKNALIDNATPLFISAITEESAAKFGPRFVLTVSPDTDQPTRRGWSMAISDPKTGVIFEPRTTQIRHLADVLKAAEGRPIGPVIFYVKGRTTLIRDANAPYTPPAPEDESITDPDADKF